MCQSVEISSAAATADPETLLPSGLESGIVAFALSTQSINALKTETFPVNGKSVICWKCFVFGASTVFLSVISAWMVTGTKAGFGSPERATEFLPGPAIVRGFSVLVHSKPASQMGLPSESLFLLSYCVCSEE